MSRPDPWFRRQVGLPSEGSLPSGTCRRFGSQSVCMLQSTWPPKCARLLEAGGVACAVAHDFGFIV
jgi:hypothetical protein